MNQELIDTIKQITGPDWVDTDIERTASYSIDSTGDSYKMVSPQPAEGSLVVKPASAQEVSGIVSAAYNAQVPLIPRGAGTALSANSIPSRPSIILSLERMNKILEVDEENMIITCEAGVSLGELLEHLQGRGSLYFPLHPGDEGAQVGGMVVMNAGGVRAVRHGVMRNQVRGLEVVLSTGEIVMMGGSEGKLIKNNAGYDLMQLMIGSEGTLGIVTKAMLRLYPEPPASGTLIVSYEERRDALESVPELLKKGVTPLAVEFFGREQIVKAAEDLKKEWPAKGGSYYLMIILSENSEDEVFQAGEVIDEVCTSHNATDILIAQTGAEQREILEIRSHYLPAVQEEIVDSPDITVPRGRLADFIDGIDKLEAKYNTVIPVSAHAGDGNLHLLIMKENGGIPPYYEDLKREAYRLGIEMGGTVTGEHGIGRLRLDLLPMMYSEGVLEIMWKIKQAFDPRNILNPGASVIPK
ncbi:MAG: FAD-binding oxidoreductase [Spirochaetaceae bacterium]